MSSPIEVVTLRCSTVFEDWCRSSVNLDLDPALDDDQYLFDCVHATCPECGDVFAIGPQLIVENDLWEFHQMS